MIKILKYIATETQGECFTSFKYCYDTIATPTIEYESGESNFINLKEYAEDVMTLNPEILEIGRRFVCKDRHCLDFSLMVRVEYTRLTTFNMTAKSFQLSVGKFQ